MAFRPLHDRVVVQALDSESKTAGGIIFPDSAKEKPSQGKVISVGPGARDNDGKIVPNDFCIMGRLDKMSKRFLAEILFGFIQRDYRKVAEVHLVAGLVPKGVPIDDLAQALRSIGEPIFGQAVKDISGGKLLKQLFDVTEKFNMQTQPQLLMLQKTMVVVEGVARKLNPNTNIWTTSKPVLEYWLKDT